MSNENSLVNIFYFFRKKPLIVYQNDEISDLALLTVFYEHRTHIVLTGTLVIKNLLQKILH